MEKIDRLLNVASRKAALYAEEHKNKRLREALRKMTTEQLIEIAYSDVSEERLIEIFESVGGLDVLESW